MLANIFPMLLQGPIETSKKRNKMNDLQQTVVVKAKVDDIEDLESLLFAYTDSLGFSMQHEDVYFNVPTGRMKLRVMLPNKSGQLIFYQRPNTFGPKVNKSVITEIDDANCLKKTLSIALGESGIVRKRRRIFIKDNVRIHLDEVVGLGAFVEFSVSLDESSSMSEKETIDVGIAKAYEVMRALKINNDQLVPCEYLDMQQASNCVDINDKKK